MLSRTALLLAVLCPLAAPVRAADVRVTLRDGSVVVGEIDSLRDGVYTLRSATLGPVQLKQSDIRHIDMTAGAAAPPARAAAAPKGTSPESGSPQGASAPAARTQVEALQQRILGNDAVLSSVIALQDDPQFQAVLNDPAIADAIRAGNLDALVGNPTFRSLLDNPKVREINRQLSNH
jgi:hypothetical protein